MNKRKQLLQLHRDQKPPVIVVGNLVAGGGGKTPLIIELTRALTARLGPGAIVCSGYGGLEAQARQVRATDDPRIHGDEAVMLAGMCQSEVFAARRRAEAYKLASSHRNYRWVIADDGLQHFELTRAVQLVCIDRRGFGNRRLLPYGPLREPLQVLRSMDALIYPDRFDPGAQPHWANQHPPIFVCPTVPAYLRRIDEAHLTGTKPAGDEHSRSFVQLEQLAQGTDLLAGIANPRAFFDFFRSHFPRVTVNQCYGLADHAPVNPKLAERLKNRTVVMTEKDAVKYYPWWCAAGKPRVDWFVLGASRKIPAELIQLLADRISQANATEH